MFDKRKNGGMKKMSSLKIAHMTDTHVLKSYEGQQMESIFTNGTQPAEKMKKMLKKVLDQKADCMIISGDIVHEGVTEDYKYVKEMVDEVLGDKVKVIYVCGNHDRKEAFCEGLEVVGSGDSIYYVTYVNEYRIVVLDSAVEGKEHGSISKEQTDWLKNTLKETYGKGTILTFHHPIVWDAEGLAMSVSNEVMDIINNSDIIAILCGHTHSNNIQPVGNTVQYTADSTAFGMELTEDNIAFMGTAAMNFYNVVEGKVSAHTETLDEHPTVLAKFSMQQLLSMMN